MANEENLQPVKTKSEARELGHNGGIKSGESKRRKKLIRETIEILLDQEVKDKKMIETMKTFGMDGTPKYKDYLIVMIILRTAKTGTISDLIKLAEFLGETSNDEPDALAEAKKLLLTVSSVIDKG